MSLLCVYKKEFIFTWNIENSLLTADACLESPTFLAENIFQTKWSLQLLTIAINGVRKLSCILKRAFEDDGPNFVCVQFEVRMDKESNSCQCIFSRGMKKSVILFHNLELSGEDFLTKGSWEIYCKLSIWDDEPYFSVIRCLARTRILITSMSRVRTFYLISRKLTEDLVVNVKLNSVDESMFKIALRINILMEKDMTIEIQNLTNRSVFLFGRISIRNDEGYFLHLTDVNVIFGNNDNEPIFLFLHSKEMAEKILDNENQIESLSLLFEFFIPDGIESSVIEYNSHEMVTEQVTSYIHQHIKSKNAESQTTDLTCGSKLLPKNNSDAHTTNAKYPKLLDGYCPNSVGNNILAEQIPKFDHKTSVGIQTSKIYCKNAASQSSSSDCTRHIGIQVSFNTDFKDFSVQTSMSENTHNSQFESEWNSNHAFVHPYPLREFREVFTYCSSIPPYKIFFFIISAIVLYLSIAYGCNFTTNH